SNELLFLKVVGSPVADIPFDISIKSSQYTVGITINTYTLPYKEYFDNFLNVNTWAYLDYPIFKNREERVVQDLIDHHNNVSVVRSGFIPRIGDFDFNRLV